jgi:tRNA dimethylallyltransferase
VTRLNVAAIVGATATGKSSVAAEVAEQLGGEIVSCDSMQLYRGMNVGTAKPSQEMRKRVPHHMLDVREPTDAMTVAEFQAEGRAVISDIAARGRLPLIVGGSGLYFRALVDPFDFPARSLELRAALEETADTRGLPALYERLERVAPSAAKKIDPDNRRRVVRALEAVELSGELPQRAWSEFHSVYDLAVAGLRLDRRVLYQRIAARAAAMVADGLVEEAFRLDSDGMADSVRLALGYRQALEHRAAPPRELTDEIVRATKRFARRQESWFRHDPRICWFDAGRKDLARAVGEHLRSRLAVA